MAQPNKGGDATRSGIAKKRYDALKTARNSVLTQAREAVRLTIPGLIPQEGASDPHASTEQPWTASGARQVNNLSAKLLLAMFPPERPFVRLDVEPDVAKEMGTGLGDAQAALADISLKALALADKTMSRTIWMEAIRHLIVAGNCLTYQPPDETQMRMWRLDQFVVRRGKNGVIQEAAIRDVIHASELDPTVLVACNIEYDPEKPEKDSAVELYTYVYNDGKSLNHYEEINGTEVPGSRGAVEIESAGWQALRWQAVPGSDYGRSYVSEYAGDFLSLEDLYKSIIKFAIEAARIIRVVDPNAGIDVEELASADSGDWLTGLKDRVETLQLDKSGDFQIAWQLAQAIERRLNQAFLLTANTIRDAERVTAEEIRVIAQELEDALGGTYTVLSAEVQRPYAKRLLYILSKLGKAPQLPEDVEVVVVTGFNALGQNHASVALMTWLHDLAGTLGEPWVTQNVNGNEVALRLGVSRGVIDVAKLLKSPEQVAQEQQSAALAQGGIAAAPQIAKGVIDNANQQTAAG